MKQLLVIAVAAGGLLSCAPDSGVLVLEQFRPLSIDMDTGACKLQTNNLYQSDGYLDVAGGAPPNVPQYWLEADLRLNTSQVGLALANSTQLEGPNRDRFSLRAIRYTYLVKKGAAAERALTATDEVPQFGVSSGAGQLLTILNAIGPKGGAALFNEVPVTTNARPVPDDIVTVRVGIQFVGNLTGSGVEAKSGVYYLPLFLYRTATCPNGPRPTLVQCPYMGQDFNPVVCAGP